METIKNLIARLTGKHRMLMFASLGAGCFLLVATVYVVTNRGSDDVTVAVAQARPLQVGGLPVT